MSRTPPVTLPGIHIVVSEHVAPPSSSHAGWYKLNDHEVMVHPDAYDALIASLQASGCVVQTPEQTATDVQSLADQVSRANR